MRIARLFGATLLFMIAACLEPDGKSAPEAEDESPETVERSSDELAVTQQKLESGLCGNIAGLQANAAWPMTGGCPTHAAQSSQFGPTAASKNWSTYLFGNVKGSPAIAADGTIFVGSDGNRFFKINATTGAILKQEPTWGRVRSAPAIGADGTVYVGDDSGTFYAVNPTTLKAKWTVSWIGAVNSSPAIAPDGTIYFGSDDDKLYAYRPDGTPKWSHPTGTDVRSSPAIGTDGTVYFGSDITLYALNPSNGTKKWSKIIGFPITSSPAVGRFGRVYIGAGDKLLAYNATDGTFLWEKSLGSCTIYAPAIGQNGVIYVGTGFSFSTGGSLYALSPDGEVLWHFDVLGGVQSTPIIDRAGNIYFGANDNKIYAVDAAGNQIWKYATLGNVQSSPALAPNGAVIVGANDNNLYSIGVGATRVNNGGACTSDAQCMPGLVCGVSNGPRFGLGAPARACVVPTCENKVQDPGETEVDCGGPCGSCTNVCSLACKLGDQVSPPALEVLPFSKASFVRATYGTYQVGTQKVGLAGGNVLRFEDRGDGVGRLALFEGARTNRLRFSEQLTHAPEWRMPTGGTPIVTTEDYAAGPQDSPTAERFVAPAAGYPSRTQTVGTNVPAGVLSAWLRLTDANGAASSTRPVLYDSQNRWFSSTTPWALQGTWARQSMATTASAASVDLAFSHKAGWPGSATQFPQLGAADFVVWGLQLEEGAFASSYIPTTDDIETRMADRLVFEAADVPAWVRTGMWQVDVAPIFASSEITTGDEMMLVAWENGGLSLGRDAAGGVLKIVSGTSSAKLNAAWPRHGKLTITVDLPSRTLTLRGASQGNGAVGIGSAAVPAGRVGVGAKLDGGQAAFARISELRRVSSTSSACTPDPDCTVCGDGRVSGSEECDVALSPACSSACTLGDYAVLASHFCSSDADCGSLMGCPAEPNGEAFGAPQARRICVRRDLCLSAATPQCGTQAAAPCGRCSCYPNCGAGDPRLVFNASDPRGTAVPPVPPPTEVVVPSDVSGSTPVPDQPPQLLAAGTIPGTGDVGADGSFTYSIPIDVPQGRLGIQPQLSLRYNHRSGNGPLGVGFSLGGLSKIERCQKTVAGDGVAEPIYFDDTDRFCLDGEGLVEVGSNPGLSQREFRTENDSFRRIIASYPNGGGEPVSFRVHDHSGLIHEYRNHEGGMQEFYVGGQILGGAAANPVRLDTNRSREVTLAWHLTTTADRSGNMVGYRYAAKGIGTINDSDVYVPREKLYLAEVLYTYNFSSLGSPQQAIFPSRKVTFHYRDRSDNVPRYIAGLRIEDPWILDLITAHAAPIDATDPFSAMGPIWSYRLMHTASATSGRSLLREVQKCDAHGVCLQPTKLSWYEGEPFENLSAPHQTARRKIDMFQKVVVGAQDLFLVSLPAIMVLDANGDGKSDLVYQTGYDRFPERRIRFSTGSGFTPPQSISVPSFSPRKQYVANYDRAADGLLWVNDVGFNYDFYAWDAVRNNFYVPSRSASELPLYTGSDGTYPTSADVYGDGVQDLLYRHGILGSSEGLFVHWLSDGKRLVGDSSVYPYTLRVQATQPMGDVLDRFGQVGSNTMVTDVEGDGKSDVFFFDPYEQLLVSRYYRLHVERGVLKFDDSLISNVGAEINEYYQWADTNGDGIKDVVGRPGIRFGVGTSYKEYSPALSDSTATDADNPLVYRKYNGLSTPGTFVADMNGDGFDDLIQVGPHVPADANIGDSDIHILLSNGRSYEHLFYDIPSGIYHEDIIGWKTFHVADFSGDGMPDILFEDGKGTTRQEDHEMVLWINRSKTADRLIGVRDGLGRVEVIKYADISDSTVHAPSSDCLAPLHCLRKGMDVVSSFGVEEPMLGLRETTYYYEGATSSLAGRGFLGFRRRTAIDVRSHRRTVQDFQPLVYTPLFTASDGTPDPSKGYVFPFARLPHRETVYVPLQDQVINTNAPVEKLIAKVVLRDHTVVRSGPTGTYRVELKSEKQKEYELVCGAAVDCANPPLDFEGLTTLRRVERKVFYDEWGNVRHEHRWVPGGTSQRISTQYINDTTNWLLGLPLVREEFSVPPDREASLVVQGEIVGGPKRTTTYEHDSRGLLTAQTAEPDDPTLRMRTAYGRDALGLLRTVTEQGSYDARVSRMDYDAEGVFPRRRENAMGHESWEWWQPGTDAVAMVMDQNRVATSFAYDGFGRVKHIEVPDQADSAFNYDFSVQSPAPFAFRVTKTVNGGPTTSEQYDQLGRVERRSFQTATGQMADSVIEYDPWNRVRAVSRPAGLGTSDPKSLFLYDSADRLRYVYDGPNFTEFQYDGLKTRRFDPVRNRMEVEENVDGHIVRSTEFDGARAVNTLYDYREFGMLDSVTDAAGFATRYNYDGLGRRTSLVSADFGARTYAYNAWGETLEELTEEGNRYVQRDKLGRLQVLESSDGETTLTWDTKPFGVGKIASAESPDGVLIEPVYDSLGRDTDTTWTIDGATYTATKGYDVFGRLATLDYPASSGPRYRVSYDYDFGWLKSVSAGTRVLWRAVERELWGPVKLEALGNGQYVRREFDVQTARLEVEHISTDPNGAGHQRLFEYYDDGSLKARTLAQEGHIDSLSYDALNRLRTWTVISGGASRENIYDYDDIGNLKTFTGAVGAMPSMTFGHGVGAGPHAVTQAAGASYSYDTRGRQRQGAGRSVTYTDFDLPSVITRGGEASEFAYDAFQRRVLKQRGATRTVYVPELYERRLTSAGAQEVFYVQAEGRIVAQVEGAARNETYLHSEPLGSVNLSSNQNGQLGAPLYFEPYGGRVGYSEQPLASNPQPAITRGFTGHEHDDELGLINMRGRMYDPLLRRFVTPDPVVPESMLMAQAKLDLANGTNYSPTGPLVAPSDGSRFQVGTSYVDGTVSSAMKFSGSTPERAESARRFSGTFTPSEPVGAGRRGLATLRSSAFNPYGYAHNNPGKFNDPSGFAIVAPGPDPFSRAADAAAKFWANAFNEAETIGEKVVAAVLGSLATLGTHENIGKTVTVLSLAPIGMVAVKGPGPGATGGGSRGTIGPTSPRTGASGGSRLQPGPFADKSVPATGPRVTPAQKEQLTKIGQETGCHTCGTKDFGTRSGKPVGDHQPATALRQPGEDQRLFPHCTRCSAQQGAEVREAMKIVE